MEGETLSLWTAFDAIPFGMDVCGSAIGPMERRMFLATMMNCSFCLGIACVSSMEQT